MVEIKTVYGSVTRKEYLKTDITMHDKKGEKVKEFKEGDIVEAVYMYETVLSGDSDIANDEYAITVAENIIQAVITKYGYNCLKNKFFNERLNKEMPGGGISCSDLRGTKFYKCTVSMRGKQTDLSSDATFLHADKIKETLSNN